MNGGYPGRKQILGAPFLRGFIAKKWDLQSHIKESVQGRIAEIDFNH